jgi:hypothetical protein
MNIDFSALLVLSAIGLGMYTLLMCFSAWYARVTGWQPPQGNRANDWQLRRRLGFVLGGLAVIVCAIGATLWQAGWAARLLSLLQAALLASAGASDLQRFHLPLPLTLLGVGVALLTLALNATPLFSLLFGVLWTALLIVVHIFVSKGSMQLGDHLATAWIALSSPANGLLAIALGDAANVILARDRGLRGQKVAAAGAWLIFATTLVATPPYFAWFFNASPAPSVPASFVSTPADPLPAPAAKPDVALSSEETLTATVLLHLAQWAGQHTASVALAETHAGRVLASRQQAAPVKHFADVAQQVAPGSQVQGTLQDLAAALSSFDLEGVRDASAQLALERERLTELVTTAVLTDTSKGPSSISMFQPASVAGPGELKGGN